jgi:hypothetical protein
MTPFDYLKEINEDKKDLIRDSDNPELAEKEYNAFIINKGLSLFADTIMFANEMNRLHWLPAIMQNDFYLNIIRKRKRFSKWHKPKEDYKLQLISEYYDYTMEKAKEVIDLFSDEDIVEIETRMVKGGLNKKKKDIQK